MLLTSIYSFIQIDIGIDLKILEAIFIDALHLCDLRVYMECRIRNNYFKNPSFYVNHIECA